LNPEIALELKIVPLLFDFPFFCGLFRSFSKRRNEKGENQKVLIKCIKSNLCCFLPMVWPDGAFVLAEKVRAENLQPCKESSDKPESRITA
jgi:hypothetical protein